MRRAIWVILVVASLTACSSPELTGGQRGACPEDERSLQGLSGRKPCGHTPPGLLLDQCLSLRRQVAQEPAEHGGALGVAGQLVGEVEQELGQLLSAAVELLLA